MPLNFKEIPSQMPGVTSWGLNAGYFQFIISFEKLFPERQFQASYKPAWGRNDPPVPLGQFASFIEATATCRMALVKLRQGMVDGSNQA